MFFKRLRADINAAKKNDPAARSKFEILLTYSGVHALSWHRWAYFLHKIRFRLLARATSQFAKWLTGIEIHPAAKIAGGVFIDHGTGVVIGATAILGNNVKLYQGVTLGAKSFPLDENGNPIKGIARHPIIGDNVIIYSNATILGRITIGEGAVIGGNNWITDSVAPGEMVTQSKAKQKKGE